MWKLFCLAYCFKIIQKNTHIDPGLPTRGFCIVKLPCRSGNCLRFNLGDIKGGVSDEKLKLL